ncbi:MAG: protein kinase, partial [Thermoguttaceae bacterium]|nr:protein kinase [Thermoguttaceae bacterium]
MASDAPASLSRTCPSREELAHFAVGKLPSPAAEAIAGHLEVCEVCAEIVVGLDRATDTLVDQLRDSVRNPVLPCEERARVVDRACAAGEWERSCVAPSSWDGNPGGVRCPHCHARTEVASGAPGEPTTCRACGGTFALAPDAPRVPHDVGHFELLEFKGQGTFGAVWKARDHRLGRVVALKLARHHRSHDVEPLLHEARAAAQIQHPNVVRVHEVGCDSGTCYIVSDYVEGSSLEERLGGQPIAPGE